jgi:Fuc2NAc and GlcNAc transferase
MAVLGTGLIRHYALLNKVLDMPNQRSSHTQPTPRGGGLAIVLAFSMGSIYAFSINLLSLAALGALNSALLVAFIGFCDDHKPVAARWRFLTHLLASGLALFFLQPLPEVLLPEPFASLCKQDQLNFGYFGLILGILFLVWCLNLFNFMDGTDGIAASEAIFVCTALAGFVSVNHPDIFAITLYLAAASLGFLFWNWPKAKIFMGDVGSGFLGLLVGILILMAAQQIPVLLFCGLILFGLFIVDASYTLLVRFTSGQKWYDAHCSHTYQRAAKRYGHLYVLCACWVINLCWLLPVSFWIFLNPAYALLGIIFAYLPLVLLALHFKAGQLESSVL